MALMKPAVKATEPQSSRRGRGGRGSRGPYGRRGRGRGYASDGLPPSDSRAGTPGGGAGDRRRHDSTDDDAGEHHGHEAGAPSGGAAAPVGGAAVPVGGVAAPVTRHDSASASGVTRTPLHANQAWFAKQASNNGRIR